MMMINKSVTGILLALSLAVGSGAMAGGYSALDGIADVRELTNGQLDNVKGQGVQLPFFGFLSDLCFTCTNSAGAVQTNVSVGISGATTQINGIVIDQRIN